MKNVNTAMPRKDFVKIPDDPNKSQAIQQVSNTTEYKKTDTFWNQLLVLFESSKKLEKKQRLSYNDLSSLFNTTFDSVRYHINKARLESNGKIKSNGRPFSLNEEQLQKLQNWIVKQPFSPKLKTVKNYIEAKFMTSLCHNSLQTIFTKINYKTVLAAPMEEQRYYCSETSIDDINLSTYFDTSPKVKEISMKVPTIVVNPMNDVYHRILAAFVPIDASILAKNNEIELNSDECDKKKKDKKNQEINKEYRQLSFDQKLLLELQSLNIVINNSESEIQTWSDISSSMKNKINIII